MSIYQKIKLRQIDLSGGTPGLDLYLMRGLPGSGKSTKIKQIFANHSVPKFTMTVFYQELPVLEAIRLSTLPLTTSTTLMKGSSGQRSWLSFYLEQTLLTPENRTSILSILRHLR